jgi:hypothetical protein
MLCGPLADFLRTAVLSNPTRLLYVGQMTTEDGALRLLKSFAEHNKFLRQDVEKSGLEPALMMVMSELVGVLGDAPAMLAIGNVIHNVDHASRTFDAEGQVIWPDKPNMYDATVITDRLIVTTWGRISEDGLSIEREGTSVKARRHITGVLVSVEPGQIRGIGAVATHHALVLTFTDGTTENIPGAEDELSAAGVTKLAALVPSFYADMAA